MGEMMVHVGADDVEGEVAGVEGLGSDASRGALFDAIAVMVVADHSLRLKSGLVAVGRASACADGGYWG
jgi:uncharacterized spore protein YtfJ